MGINQASINKIHSEQPVDDGSYCEDKVQDIMAEACAAQLEEMAGSEVEAAGGGGSMTAGSPKQQALSDDDLGDFRYEFASDVEEAHEEEEADDEEEPITHRAGGDTEMPAGSARRSGGGSARTKSRSSKGRKSDASKLQGSLSQIRDAISGSADQDNQAALAMSELAAAIKTEGKENRELSKIESQKD